MTANANEQIVRDLIDAWSANEPTSPAFERIFAPTFVCHGPPEMNHSHEQGAENCVFYIFKSCFDNLAFDVKKLSVDGDRAVTEFTVRGRQIAEFRGIAPKGGESVFNGLVILRIADGKVAEGWGSLNWG